MSGPALPSTVTGQLRRRPSQRRATDRVARILDGADAVLVADGTLGTTAVAAAAGVSVGSVYHWFPDKEAITCALARRHWDELADLVAAVAERASCGASPDPIGEAFAALVAGFRTRPGFLALWFGPLRTEELRAETRPSRDAVAESVQRILAITHPHAPPDRGAAVAQMVTLLGDGILREAFRLDRTGDPVVLAEGEHALRAYVTARLHDGGDGDG